jgi:hypothetical protein
MATLYQTGNSLPVEKTEVREKKLMFRRKIPLNLLFFIYFYSTGNINKHAIDQNRIVI